MKKEVLFRKAFLLLFERLALAFSFVLNNKTRKTTAQACSTWGLGAARYSTGKPALASGILLLLFSVGVQQSVFGQVSITSLPQTYTQDFNQLSSTASTSWTNNTTATLPNWYIYPAISSLTISTGTNTSGGVFNLGNTGVGVITDRALGCLQSGNTAQYFGVRLKNNSSNTITSFDISFTGEQWRQNAAGSLIFEYRVSSSAITSLTTGTWTTASQFNFAALKSDSGASALDGNDPTNRTAISNTLTVNVPAGSEIMLRWSRTSNSSPILAVDDLSIIAKMTASLTPPTLTAAANATVDAPFDVTFTEDATWRNAISSITIGGTTLTAGYTVSAGKITFTPSASTLLQSAGAKSIIVFATGYNNATVTQTIGAGAASKLSMNTEPTAPTANGGALVTQPKVNILDQYGNATTSTASITAAVGAGTWGLGGTPTVSASAGVATFTNLTATSGAPVTGATITFSSSGLTGVTSATFNIPGSPPTLTAAANATVDAPFDVTFTDDATWRAAISSITVGGTTLPASAYSATTAGKITFTPSASTLLQSPGAKSIIVTATGYNNATVTQTIGAGAASKLSMNTQPTAPTANGGALATQPKVNILDQYGNATTSTASITAAVGAGTWGLGGTPTVSASAGVATFTNLTATSAAPVTGATITFSSSGLTGVTSATFNIPGSPPTLTAAANATVDAPFDVTFTDDATWRAAISSITVGGTTLATSAYSTTTAGKITFTPSNSTLLQTAGAKSIIVSATGYATSSVTQQLGVGEPFKLVISTPPTAPASNGAVLAAQPIVNVTDKYNNVVTTSTATVTATVGAGTWVLGGTLTVSASAGLATFTNLTATSVAAVTGATITFTSPDLTPVTSTTFNIIAPTNPAPVATAATNVNATSFTANWNAMPGATSYELDVYTKLSNTTPTEATATNVFANNGYTNGETLPSGTISNGLLTFTTEQNDSGTAPAYYDTGAGIRIYGNTQAGNGNTFTLNITGGITVTKVDFVTGAGTQTANYAYYVDNATTAAGTGTFTSTPGTTSISGLSAISKFVIQNTSLTGSSAARLSKIVVTYTYNGTSIVENPITNSPFSVTAPTILKDVTGLTPSTTYYYRVRAKNGSTSSANSNEIQVITRPDTTSWDGNTWSNGAPALDMYAIVNGALSMTTSLEAKSITVNSGGSVIVTTGKTLRVANEVNNETNDATKFIVESGASLIQNNAAAVNAGPITVKRNSYPLYLQDYTLWASPVANQNLRNFSPNTLYNRFYSYDTTIGPNGNWVQEIVTTADMNTKTFGLAKGYLIRMPNNWTAFSNLQTPGTVYPGVFVGVPNSGTITYTLSNANTGYNLVGNPYPSPISVASFRAANPGIGGTLYFYRKRNAAVGSGYGTLSQAGFAGNVSVNNFGLIEVGQGFFVKANGVSTLNFTNGMRAEASANAVFLRSSSAANTALTNDNPVEMNRFWLNLVKDNEQVGQALIGYIEGTTLGVDEDFDAKYFNDSALALTSIINNQEYIIQARPVPFVATDVVPLGFKTDVAGTYTFALGNKEGLFADATQNPIYLKDNTTNTLHHLNSGVYTFNSAAGVFNTRFEIWYEDNTLGNPSFGVDHNVNVYKQNKTIVVDAGTTRLEKIEIWDTLGRLLFTTTTSDTRFEVKQPLMENQVLLIKITTEKGSSNKKMHY